MELNHLRAFYEVAKAGGFSMAARKLRISQSALSKAVGLLESHHGVQLFERGKKGVQLTPAGQGIFADCLTVFSHVEKISDTLRGKAERCEGLLRFGASDHLARYRLVDKLADFQDLHQGIIPSLFVGSPPEVTTRVGSGDLEFGLSFTLIPSPGVEYVSLGKSELVLVHRAKRRADGNKSHQSLPIIASISREYQKHPSQRAFDVFKGRAIVGLECNSQELQKLFCLAGKGHALLARFMVADEISAKNLTQVKTAERIFADFYLLKRKTHVLSVGARTFIDEIVRHLDV